MMESIRYLRLCACMWLYLTFSILTWMKQPLIGFKHGIAKAEVGVQLELQLDTYLKRKLQLQIHEINFLYKARKVKPLVNEI